MIGGVLQAPLAGRLRRTSYGALIECRGELLAVFGNEFGLARSEGEDRQQLPARFALAPLLRPAHDLKELFHCLAIAPLRRVAARKRKARFMVRRIVRQALAQLSLGRRLALRARESDALAQRVDAR